MFAGKQKVVYIFGIMLLLALTMTTGVWAKQEKEEKQGKKAEEAKTFETKTVTGEVGVIRPGYITVIYGKETRQDGTVADYEMVIPFDENVKLMHLKSIDALKEGDSVEVTAEEASWVDEDDVGRSERKAKEIRFISPKGSGLRSGI